MDPVLPFLYRYPCPMRLPITMLSFSIVAHLYDL